MISKQLYLIIATCIASSHHFLRSAEMTTPQAFIAFSENASPYKILGISSNADQKEIEKAFKKISLKIHPDKWPSQQKAATEAYQIIVNARDEAMSNLSAAFSIQPKQRPNKNTEAMMRAARQGTLTKESLQKYINDGVDINAEDEYGLSALTQAATANKLAIVKLLLDAGANSIQRAFNAAIFHNRLEVVDFFIKRGVKVDAKTLEYAEENSSDEMVKLLKDSLTKVMGASSK